MIYFIGCGDFVKIGTTKNAPEARLSTMQTGNPHPLRVMRTIFGGQAEEKQLHERFRQYRVRGEWFRCEGALAKYISLYPDEELETECQDDYAMCFEGIL